MWESLLDDHASNSQIDKLDGVAVKQVLESHGVKVEKLRDDIKKIAWKDVFSPLDGKRTRKSSWYTKDPCRCPYSYGNSSWPSNMMPQWMCQLASVLEELTGLDIEGESLDGINCNLYDNLAQHLTWHSDNEPIFKKKDGEATIVSLSFGLARKFEWRKKHDKDNYNFTTLDDLDILVMKKKTQIHWEHRVPALGTSDGMEQSQPRINLTFRYIAKHSEKCPCNSSH